MYAGFLACKHKQALYLNMSHPKRDVLCMIHLANVSKDPFTVHVSGIKENENGLMWYILLTVSITFLLLYSQLICKGIAQFIGIQYIKFIVLFCFLFFYGYFICFVLFNFKWYPISYHSPLGWGDFLSKFILDMEVKRENAVMTPKLTVLETGASSIVFEQITAFPLSWSSRFVHVLLG